jgi:DNA helicase-2/ATP-dependent DNA helicase PcrA
VDETPLLDGDALAAVRHRGSHVQIIASAGSGKTEVVAQRVADLIADGIAARSIVAFTLTERAAQELKDRIALRRGASSWKAGTGCVGRFGSVACWVSNPA